MGRYRFPASTKSSRRYPRGVAPRFETHARFDSILAPIGRRGPTLSAADLFRSFQGDSGNSRKAWISVGSLLMPRITERGSGISKQAGSRGWLKPSLAQKRAQQPRRAHALANHHRPYRTPRLRFPNSAFRGLRRLDVVRAQSISTGCGWRPVLDEASDRGVHGSMDAR